MPYAMSWPVRLLLLLCTFAALTGCARNRVTGELDLNWYSEAGDAALGREVMVGAITDLTDQEVPVDVDLMTLEKLRQMLARIVAVTEYADDEVFRWEIHLAEVGIANAFAAPGGRIMVFRGLLDPEKGLVASDDELAGVIAHEVAHVTLRHGTRGRSRRWTLWGVLLVPGVILNALIPGAGSLFDVVSTQGVNLALPAYSRSAEREADRVGLIYMARAGYDPRAMPAMWRRAEGRRGEGGNALASLYASHPGDEDRAAELDALLSEVVPLYEAAVADE